MIKSTILLLLLLLLCGCDNAPQLTALQHADSLMNEHLDSAYQLIKGINPDHLSAKDNAYHSLLLTTAQYKKSEPIPNDSIIGIAVEYYINHFDQDKLTRALMYKGGVLADLNYNKLALDSYKEAEKIADTLNFMTMGLLNFRLGELYRKSYIKNDEHIKRYKQALNYFHKSKHAEFENNARSVIGQLYSTRNYDSAHLYLNQALEIAEKLKNQQQIANSSFVLSKFYDCHDKNLKKAKDLALVVYKNRDSITIGCEIYSHLSTLYSKLGIIDSAIYFYKQCPPPVTSLDSMNYYMMQKELSISENDYKSAFDSYIISERIGDSLVKHSKSEELYAIDKEFDNQVIKTQKAQLEASNYIKSFIIIGVVLLLIIGSILWFFYSNRRKNILIQKEQFIDELQNKLQHILQNLAQGKEIETTLKIIVETRIDIIKKLLNIKYQYGSKPTLFFDKFDELIAINHKSEKECDNIISIANSLHSGVIDHIEMQHPSLKRKEKLLLSLVCLGFSPIEMLVFLNLNNIGSIYSLRSRLMKKLCIKSLDEYVNEQILLLGPKPASVIIQTITKQT